MKEMSYYETNPNPNLIPYPRKDDFKRYNFYCADKCLAYGITEAELENLEIYKRLKDEHATSNAQRCISIINFKDFLTKKEIFICKYYLDDAFKLHSDKYHENNVCLFNEFKAAVLEEFDVTGSAKAEKLFNKTFEDKCSDGYQAVFNAFEEYVNFVKD
jgi:hypothetical protein